jgi:hypothetical protein
MVGLLTLEWIKRLVLRTCVCDAQSGLSVFVSGPERYDSVTISARVRVCYLSRYRTDFPAGMSANLGR